ncbi:unnamed protein product [Gordionus sp. m RMFG-2023]|uniref:uncharacterized protein LOC135930885 n=1 Tax=Gordionus sp. m RMFG-2023 TaxID=3053472 RepID=UPI0030E2C017
MANIGSPNIWSTRRAAQSSCTLPTPLVSSWYLQPRITSQNSDTREQLVLRGDSDQTTPVIVTRAIAHLTPQSTPFRANYESDFPALSPPPSPLLSVAITPSSEFQTPLSYTGPRMGYRTLSSPAQSNTFGALAYSPSISPSPPRLVIDEEPPPRSSPTSWPSHTQTQILRPIHTDIISQNRTQHHSFVASSRPPIHEFQFPPYPIQPRIIAHYHQPARISRQSQHSQGTIQPNSSISAQLQPNPLNSARTRVQPDARTRPRPDQAVHLFQPNAHVRRPAPRPHPQTHVVSSPVPNRIFRPPIRRTFFPNHQSNRTNSGGVIPVPRPRSHIHGPPPPTSDPITRSLIRRIFFPNHPSIQLNLDGIIPGARPRPQIHGPPAPVQNRSTTPPIGRVFFPNQPSNRPNSEGIVPEARSRPQIHGPPTLAQNRSTRLPTGRVVFPNYPSNRPNSDGIIPGARIRPQIHGPSSPAPNRSTRPPIGRVFFPTHSSNRLNSVIGIPLATNQYEALSTDDDVDVVVSQESPSTRRAAPSTRSSMPRGTPLRCCHLLRE